MTFGSLNAEIARQREAEIARQAARRSHTLAGRPTVAAASSDEAARIRPAARDHRKVIELLAHRNRLSLAASRFRSGKRS
jgi:hypothetical protein